VYFLFKPLSYYLANIEMGAVQQNPFGLNLEGFESFFDEGRGNVDSRSSIDAGQSACIQKPYDVAMCREGGGQTGIQYLNPAVDGHAYVTWPEGVGAWGQTWARCPIVANSHNRSDCVEP
jgi:hypothetical protein